MITEAQQRFIEAYKNGVDLNRMFNPSQYVVSSFGVEEIPGSSRILVYREYYPSHAPSVKWSSCHLIGAKGAVRKTVYQRLI